MFPYRIVNNNGSLLGIIVLVSYIIHEPPREVLLSGVPSLWFSVHNRCLNVDLFHGNASLLVGLILRSWLLDIGGGRRSRI